MRVRTLITLTEGPAGSRLDLEDGPRLEHLLAAGHVRPIDEAATPATKKAPAKKPSTKKDDEGVADADPAEASSSPAASGESEATDGDDT